jgi:hypothetical protein
MAIVAAVGAYFALPRRPLPQHQAAAAAFYGHKPKGLRSIVRSPRA